MAEGERIESNDKDVEMLPENCGTQEELLPESDLTIDYESTCSEVEEKYNCLNFAITNARSLWA